jgi:hypothetical protein
MGYITENKCIEINGLDLKGGYVGQSAIITKQIIELSKGGILFIDEAYALCESKGNSFGKEAISVLLKEMEDNRGDLIVIFAGYEDDMNKFLEGGDEFNYKNAESAQFISDIIMFDNVGDLQRLEEIIAQSALIDYETYKKTGEIIRLHRQGCYR